MYALLDSGSRRRDVGGAVRPRAAPTPRRPRRLTRCAPAQSASRPGNAIAVQMQRRHADLWGTLRETLERAADRQRLGRPRRAAARAPVPRPAPRRAAAPGDAAAAAGHAAGQRRHPAGRGSRAHARRSRTSPMQIVGTLGPIPHADAARYRGQGYPPDAKVGLDGLERIFQTRLAGTPGGHAAGRPPRARHAPQPVPGQPVQTTISPRPGAGRGRRAGRPVRGDRGHGPAHRRPAGAGRDRLLGPAAARLDDEDRHRGGARCRPGSPSSATRYPIATSADDRRLHAAERRRRGLRRHAAQRVRGLLQLGVRAARREAGRRSGWSRSPSASASTSRPPIPGAAESTIPSARTIGERPGGRLLGDRPGHGARHPARDGRRRRDDRDGRPAPDPHPARPPEAPLRPGDQPTGRPRGPADDDRRRPVRAPGPRPRSPGSWSPARPAPPSSTDTASPGRLLSCRTPTRGSSATPRPAIPASWPARCSPTRAPGAPRRRRRCVRSLASALQH